MSGNSVKRGNCFITNAVNAIDVDVLKILRTIHCLYLYFYHNHNHNFDLKIIVVLRRADSKCKSSKPSCCFFKEVVIH